MRKGYAAGAIKFTSADKNHWSHYERVKDRKYACHTCTLYNGKCSLGKCAPKKRCYDKPGNVKGR